MEETKENVVANTEIPNNSESNVVANVEAEE